MSFSLSLNGAKEFLNISDFDLRQAFEFFGGLLKQAEHVTANIRRFSSRIALAVG
jgi:hypothetical protein